MTDSRPSPGTITIAIQRAQDGDSDEFTKLVNLHQKDVERLAKFFLGGEKKSNLMLGEDVMQSVFLQLWQGLSSGKTWFVSALTDREQLLNVLERMTWLRARKAIRHSNQQKRLGTLRDSDTESNSGHSLSSSFQDGNAANPANSFEVKSLVEEAYLKIKAVDSQLLQVFEDILHDVDASGTADKLGISKRGVQRKRQRVRSILENWMTNECQHFAEDC